MHGGSERGALAASIARSAAHPAHAASGRRRPRSSGLRPQLLPLQMLVEARHDLDEIAGRLAVVELLGRECRPRRPGRRRASPAGRRRTCSPASPGGRPRLDRRGADLVVADQVEDGREAVHPLVEERLDRFRRDVAPGEAGAAGGDDRVDRRVGDPSPDLAADLADVVGDDSAIGENVSGLLDALGERAAGLVVARASACPTPSAPRSGPERTAGRVVLIAAPLITCPVQDAPVSVATTHQPGSFMPDSLRRTAGLSRQRRISQTPTSRSPSSGRGGIRDRRQAS